MSTIRVLTRDQLARFLGNNQEAIRYFEQLTAQASSDADQIVILVRLSQEVAIEANNAIAVANSALAEIAEAVGQLGLALEAPPIEPIQIPDDLTPPVQLGTLASQNADSVEVGNLTAAGDVVASGDVDAVNMDASGDVSGVNLTASGDVSAVNVAASGDVGAVNVDATGNVEAATYSVNGNAGASGTGATITAITVENGIVTAITVT